jgi:hypothetical protein
VAVEIACNEAEEQTSMDWLHRRSLCCHNSWKIFLQMNKIKDTISERVDTQHFFLKDSFNHQGSGTEACEQGPTENWQICF